MSLDEFFFGPKEPRQAKKVGESMRKVITALDDAEEELIKLLELVRDERREPMLLVLEEFRKHANFFKFKGMF